MNTSLQIDQDIVFFDMDGTIVDSRDAAVQAVQKGLPAYFEQQGISRDVPSPEKIESLIGLPSLEYFQALLPDVDQRQAEDIRDVVENLELQEILSGTVDYFDGMPGLLEQLSEAPPSMVLVTNGGRPYFEAMIEQLGFDVHFDELYCVDDSPTGKKVDLVREILDASGTEDGVLIGDTTNDMRAAHGNDLPFIGCLWGFDRQEEIQEAEELVSTPVDLQNVFLHNHSDLGGDVRST